MTARVLGPSDLAPKIEELYRQGLPAGDRTGWSCLDKFYSVAPGQVTIVTGWPSSGKSEWLDAMLVHLAQRGWSFAIYSPENWPQEVHSAKIIEKIVGLPFGAGPSQRMTQEDIAKGLAALRGRFGFMASETGDIISVQSVIDAAEPWLMSVGWSGKGKKGLVIDPWNELEHHRPKNLTETEYVSQTLSHVRAWARSKRVHVWIVAHPKNVPRENGKLPVPRPDMISGSQHWWNKADNAITVWRNMENPDDQNIDIHVQKVRFKHIGRPGMVTLRYDRVTGRYHEVPTLQDVNAYRYKGTED